MNALKKSIDHFAHGLSGISRAQKISGGILVTLTILAMVIFKQQESGAQMQPILDQKLSADESKQIVARLQEQNVPYKIGKDKKILVPIERKLEVLADLGYADLLPADTEHGFDKIINSASVWDTSSKTDMMYKRAKEATLAKIIGKFPGVKSALVMIDTPIESHIGQDATPTATVNIYTSSEVKDLQQLASAAASVVAGAQADLKRERIEVTVDGVPYSPIAQANPAADPFDRKQKIAKQLAQQVTEHLAIANVLVSVSVDSSKRTQLDTSWYGPSLLEPSPAKRLKYDTVVSASVNVPRSYFVNKFKSANVNAKEPDDAVLAPIVLNESEKIRRKASACLGLKDESLVSVDSYTDATVAAASAPVESLSSAPLWSSHIKQIAFGILIVVSLLMLSLLVRRHHEPQTAPVLALSVERRAALPDYIDAEYVDHDEEMMSHVKSLVDENPDQAALMVRRWLELKR